MLHEMDSAPEVVRPSAYREILNAWHTAGGEVRERRAPATAGGHLPLRSRAMRREDRADVQLAERMLSP